LKLWILDRWHRLGDPIETLIIAHSRADVRELNGRARAIHKASGRLGSSEVWGVAGAFAAGDIVAVKLNSKRHDVRNGDRGLIVSVDSRSRSLRVAIGDRTVELDNDFLARRTRTGRPALEHGYATTAHSAQGATCRPALVLARDDAYREWAYSAITRATEGSHLFLVADTGRERDSYAPREPQPDGRAVLAAALRRERADELAIERLDRRSDGLDLSR
jgi:ATP-dependent exoDNAse (exonuclease V) alpha subunit